mmetsp:Transcript_40543/g.82887  ORF Transcript_40543/g.82887 Transcript_40543/m.82887 type:complete len:162 (-) Transcript_40543:222-707(-)
MQAPLLRSSATTRKSVLVATIGAVLLAGCILTILAMASQEASSAPRIRAQSLLGVENGVRPSDLAMPWLNQYNEDSEMQKQEDAKYAAEGEVKVTEPKPDPLWCGSASCAEFTYARFAHHFARSKAHLVVNEAALKAPPSLSEGAGGHKHFWELWAQNRQH